MFQEYKLLCKSDQLKPGGHYLYKDSSPWVLNLATQDTRGGAKIEFVEKCLENLSEFYIKEGITSLAMPRIAAGLGGLKWTLVKELINEILAPLPISIYVYENFEKFVQANETI